MWRTTSATLAICLALCVPAAGGYNTDEKKLPSPAYDSGEIDGSNYTYDGLDRRIRTDNNISLPMTWIDPPEFPAESFFDVSYSLEIELAPGVVSTWEGTTVMQVMITPLPPAGAVSAYEVEVLALDQWDAANPGYIIRENPAIPSTGLIEFTDLGDGTYWVESFFDIYTELSLDGGGMWAPVSEPWRMTGTPEPATMSLLVVGVAALVQKRRRNN